MTLRWMALAVLALAGCATPVAPPAGEGWHPVALPGKPATRYEWTTKDGRPALAASADRSASMWRRRVMVPPAQLGEVRFSWWVDALLPGADVSDAEREDAPARVLFAFQGDDGALPARTRMLFELAETLSGERPPYATLMYVYGQDGPTERIVVNPRTDRVRKIVLDAGPVHLRRWRDHRRDLAADFRRAFGEAPGALVAVAVMTDSDNTRQQARAWYGAIDFHP